VCLVVAAVAIAVTLFAQSNTSRAFNLNPEQGYQDPATAIHITSTGEIEGSNLDSSSVNLHCNGSVYTLAGPVTNWIIIEKSNIIFDGNGFTLAGSHGLSLSFVSNVTVRNLHIQTYYLQMLLDHSKKCILQNVDSSFEIVLFNSDENLISNCSGAIRLENSDSNSIQSCTAREITLDKSNGNSILCNTISLQGPSLEIWSSSNNLVFGNTFSKFWWWITMTGSSANNKIVANNVWAGQLYLADKLVGTNYIYHNNFYNFNWNQSATTNSVNVWSSGGRGNYWANFSGVDLNGDGVADTFYVIDQNNSDLYPLVTPIDISVEPLPK